MDTDTTTIKTPVKGQEVVLRNWITGAQADHIQSAFFEGLEVSQADLENFGDIKIPASKLITFNAKKLDVYVVSVDGVTENAGALVREMHQEDTAFVLAKVDELSKKK